MLRAITLNCIAFLAFSMTLYAGEWIIHVTPDNGPYKTEILIANNSPNAGKITFKHPLREEFHTVAVSGGRTLAMAPEEFSFYPMGSLEIIGRASSIQVSARYVSPDLEVPLTVPATDDTANVMRFNNPSPQGDWQGLALINLGDEVASTRLTQYDDNQNVLYEVSLTDLLLPNSKFLSLLSSVPLARNPNSYFEIHSSQPISALLLTGGQTLSGKSYLTANRSTTRTLDSIRVVRSGGLAGVNDSVTIEGIKYCTRTGFGTRYSETCDVMTDADQEGLSRLVEESNILDMEVALVEPFENNCSDQFQYSVEVNWNGRVNVFSYDDCEVPHLSNGEAARAFVNDIFNFAEALSSGDSTQ